jgi:RNA polymerase sigma factor (sigma-70 family)
MKKEIREQAKIIASKFGKTYDQRQDIEGRCLEAAWLAESKLDEEKNPKAYIDRAMKNAAIDYLRDEKKAEALPLDEDLAIPYEDPIEHSDSPLPEFIENLESPDKEILTMIAEGLSLEEIGKQLNLRPNSIAVRLHRNKKIWKDKLKL